VPRPTSGKAVTGQTQTQGAKHTWTKLLLPATFGSGKRGSHPVVYLPHKADLKDGKLLADARFCRDRLGRWSCVVQRAPVVPRPRRNPEDRTTVFLDPGSRTGWVGYSPDGLEVSSYVAGEGGTGRIMSLALKTDATIREQKALPQRAPANHARFIAESKKQKYRLQARVKDLVRDAHRRVARDLTARYDTIVLPLFETQRMVRKPPQPGDPRRKLNAKAARALLTLSHFKFRAYLEHRCRVDGRELHTPGEEYTTKACPHCGTCYDVGGSKTFTCAGCSYVADRDEKAAFTYALKSMRLGG
jgi:putative transposase